ncbi:MAG: Trm112 family protein [Thiotrichales bacterium]|nr:MAG: Trm112 family protein [Thiotrichales bacterium]
MNRKLLDILACPVCKGRLHYDRKKSRLECHQDNLAFPVRNDVPVLLVMDARPLEPGNK